VSDLLEQQLRQRLRDVGSEVPAELEPPADLELRVKRFRRRRANQRRSKLVAVAAVLLIAVTVGSVLARTQTRQAVEVASEKVSRVGVLRPNVAMLDARDRYVVALDARGRQLATYVVTRAGSEIADVQVTSDHRTLWYLSRDVHSTGCGRVVRADIGTGQSRIVVNASEFAINPDGAQLAYVACDHPARTAVLDLVSGEINTENSQLRFVGYSGANELLPQSVVGDKPNAIGPNSVYVVSGPLVQQLKPDGVVQRTLAHVGAGWSLDQVVPTRAGVFVFGRHGHDAPALYRIVEKKLRLVRTYEYGHLTGVLARR
jgi:hypothetical protein